MKKWIQIIIPLAIFLFSAVTVRRAVDSDGGFDYVYGFPMTYTTSSIAWTHHFEVYLFPLFVDLTLYVLLAALLVWIISRTGIRIAAYKLFTLIGWVVVVIFIGLFYLRTFESSFYIMGNTPYKQESIVILWGPVP